MVGAGTNLTLHKTQNSVRLDEWRQRQVILLGRWSYLMGSDNTRDFMHTGMAAAMLSSRVYPFIHWANHYPEHAWLICSLIIAHSSKTKITVQKVWVVITKHKAWFLLICLGGWLIDCWKISFTVINTMSFLFLQKLFKKTWSKLKS